MRTLTLATLAGALLLGTPALSQSLCGARATITDRLMNSYSERPAGGGLRNEDSLFEVWSTESGSTWTLLMTRSNGVTCIVASGTDWYGPRPLPRQADRSG